MEAGVEIIRWEDIAVLPVEVKIPIGKSPDGRVRVGHQIRLG
jgi:hypothetical protein